VTTVAGCRLLDILTRLIGLAIAIDRSRLRVLRAFQRFLATDKGLQEALFAFVAPLGALVRRYLTPERFVT
jgi:hypothetical protein